MKRLSIRLGIIGALMATGILAIAQAQRGNEKKPDVPVGEDGAGLALGTDGMGGDISPPAQMTPTQPQPVLENPSLAPTGLAPMGVAPAQGYAPDPGADEYNSSPPPNVYGAGSPPPNPPTGLGAMDGQGGAAIVEVNAAPIQVSPGETYASEAPPIDPGVVGVAGIGDAPPMDPGVAGIGDAPPMDPGVAGIGDAHRVDPGVAGIGEAPPMEPGVAGIGDAPPMDPGVAGIGDIAPVDPGVTGVAGLGDAPSMAPVAGDPSVSQEGLAEIAPGNDPSSDVPGGNSYDYPSAAPLRTEGPPSGANSVAGMADQNIDSRAQPYATGAADPTRPTGPMGVEASVGGVGGPLAAQGSLVEQPSAADERPLGNNYGGNNYGGNPSVPGAAPQPSSVAPVAASEQDEIRSAPVPGARQFEGQQTPFVSIEKRAPQEIRVGQPATFEIVVRNSGQVAAQDVTVMDQIPQGTQFIDATPQPQQLPSGVLVWSFGAIEPGQDRLVSLRLMPQKEGEIGSVAKVICQSQASVRTVCTRPALGLKQTAPSEVLIGDELQVLVEVSNPGTGAAENVVLEADLPPGLVHRKGRELYYAIGTLQPQETRAVRLHLATEQAGVSDLTLRASSGNIAQQDSIKIQVVAPTLQTRIIGPGKRYLRREAAFELELANPGTATARDIQAVVYLPQGLQYKSASHQGRYQPQNHAIVWRLEELPQGKSGKVQFAAMPVADGDQSLRAEARGNLNTSASGEHTLAVESLNELVFTVADVNDPIEVGSETTYEIRVTNNGSKTDSNIEVIAQLPPGMRLVDADGPTKHQAEGEVISFGPLARLDPNAEAVYRLSAQGSVAGDHRLRVQIRSQESPTPVSKEEVTRVYEDR